MKPTLLLSFAFQFLFLRALIASVLTGSGCAISETKVLTAFHVVENASEIKVFFQGESMEATIGETSKTDDWAVLELKGKSPAWLQVTPPREPVLGEKIYTLGFPSADLLGVEVKYTNGTVSAINGFDLPLVFQMSIPIQPGNSGGPVFSENGEFLGIVSGSLSSPFFAEKNNGELPQNVNFAVKATHITPISRTAKGDFVSKSIQDNLKTCCLVAAEIPDAAKTEQVNPGELATAIPKGMKQIAVKGFKQAPGLSFKICIPEELEVEDQEDENYVRLVIGGGTESLCLFATDIRGLDIADDADLDDIVTAIYSTEGCEILERRSDSIHGIPVVFLEFSERNQSGSWTQCNTTFNCFCMHNGFVIQLSSFHVDTVINNHFVKKGEELKRELDERRNIIRTMLASISFEQASPDDKNPFYDPDKRYKDAKDDYSVRLGDATEYRIFRKLDFRSDVAFSLCCSKEWKGHFQRKRSQGPLRFFNSDETKTATKRLSVVIDRNSFTSMDEIFSFYERGTREVLAKEFDDGALVFYERTMLSGLPVIQIACLKLDPEGKQRYLDELEYRCVVLDIGCSFLFEGRCKVHLSEEEIAANARGELTKGVLEVVRPFNEIVSTFKKLHN